MRYGHKGPQSWACPHLLRRKPWPLPSLHLFLRCYSAALVPSSSIQNLVAWACWDLFFSQTRSITNLRRISHVSVNKIQQVQSLSESSLLGSKRKFSLQSTVSKHQAEAAAELQISSLWHHSSSNLAQPLCTSLQRSLSGSCCKIWLHPGEEQGRQETTAGFPTDRRRFIIVCW